MTRREFSVLPLAATALTAAPRTKMTIQLDCGSIGVKASPPEALQHAVKHGFETISADSGWIASLPDSDLKRFLDEMKAKGIAWGNAGLPAEFRRTEEDFEKGVTALANRTGALRKAGVTRMTTWISPTHDSLTYLANLKQHRARLGKIAAILDGDGIRLGLEYVGPKTSWTARRFPFVHTMKEMKDLIAEIGKPNVGFVLDSWHWYTAGETVADLETLTNKDIVSVDLNDAPAGIALDQQKDGTRELPCATGVIDMAGFLNALNKLGCDAPARCEPFNAPLRQMPPEQALAATAEAMKKAFALIR